jgi:hypothetical protein
MFQQIAGTEPFKSRIAPNDPEAIRLLLPHTSRHYREQNTTQAISGFDLRRLYSLAETSPAVSYAPAPEELAKDLGSHPCAVIHIVAAVREFSGGIFLDFESTEGRIYEERGLGFSFLTPTFLDRILASLEQPPFVILDIARSDNDAETLRRLLLRNTYADQLHRLGNTCGVLATGLADRFGQESLIDPLVRQLTMGVPISMILRHIRANQQPTSPYHPLISELPSLGAALFADEPHLSPFAPRRSSA